MFTIRRLPSVGWVVFRSASLGLRILPQSTEMHFICLATLMSLVISIKSGILEAPVSLDDHSPQYEFQYSVHDSYTGDIKDHFEHRRGDYVAGRYSLIEPDGTRRVVDYSSDPLFGFTANVHHERAVDRPEQKVPERD